MSPLVVDGPRPAVEWVTALPHRLTDAEHRVLLLLALDSYDGHTAAPGYDRLAQWSGLLRSSVAAAIARLCEPTKDRPALLRRVGRRQRLTVFAFIRPAEPDACLHDLSGRAGPYDSSGPPRQQRRDTPVKPSGSAGHTLPSSTPTQQVQQHDGPSHSPRYMHLYFNPKDRYVLVRMNSNGSRWLRDHNFPAFRSRPQNGYFMRPERVADLLAAAEHEGINVRLHHRSTTARHAGAVS